MSGPLVLPLESCGDPALVGGKAAGLCHLIRQAFPVPPGVCLTTVAYNLCLRSADVRSDASWQALKRVSEDNRRGMLEEIRDRIQAVSIESSIRHALNTALLQVLLPPSAGSPLWAVRSSATNEDSAQASFAGLYRSVLGVSPDSLDEAIRSCWASVWSEGVFSYYQRAGLRTGAPAMAVIIQSLLTPIAAGVAYSQHPVTGRRDVVVVNAVYGIAEPLVSGQAVPDHYVVEITSGDQAENTKVVERDIADKLQRRVPLAAGVGDEPVLEEERIKPALSDQDVIKLAQLVKRIEQATQQPVDVEWAIDPWGAWFLQARPILQRSLHHGVTPESCVWSRANFKETLPDVPSPLGLSFLETFMETSMLSHYQRLGCVIPPGISSVRIFQGRPYINLTLFQSFMAQLGGNPALITEQMGGEEAVLRNSFQRLPGWKLVRAAGLMMWTIRQSAKRAPAWFSELKRLAQTQKPEEVDTLSPPEIMARLDRLGQRLYAGDLTFAIVAGVGQGLQALSFLLERWIGDGWRELFNASLQGQGNVISAKQILWLAELAQNARQEPLVAAFLLADPWLPEEIRVRLGETRFLHEFDAYLTEYGHRGIGESDVMSPRFEEQPEYLLAVIRAHLQATPSHLLTDMFGLQTCRRQDALRQIRRAFGWRLYQWIIFQWWHRRLCRYFALREENRHHLMYFSSAVRRLVLSMGEKLTRQGRMTRTDDVFYLTVKECSALLEHSNRDWKSLVAARCAERARNEACQTPDTIEAGWSDEMIAGAGEREQTSGDVSLTLKGVPISTGRVQGPVCMVRSPSDLRKVKHGDILVAPVIDPGMAPLFGLAAGLVVEMGGTLSHGAIIAREYGIPTIANVLNVTRVFKDGDEVVVDATRGTVQRILLT